MLDRRRSGGGFGALAISFSDIESFCRLRGERLAPWELNLLDRMETTRLRLLNAPEEEPEAPPLTPDSFKSLFSKSH